jgi:hypothetical protein
MKLFGWLKNDPGSKGLVPGRAVAIPHYPRVETLSSSVENNFSANSVSTLSVTLRLLQPGDTAEAIGSQYERLPPKMMHRTTNTPDRCQRLHCNCPNWVHLLVRQEGYVHKEHTEVPVWVNPATGKMDRIDKDKLIEELEPERERALLIWKVAGMSGPYIEGGAVPEEAEGVPQAASMGTPTGEDAFKPDMSQYPPIEGVDLNLWAHVAANLVKQRIAPNAHDQFAQSQGAPAGRWAEIDRAWNQRMMSDWKLGAAYGEAYEQAMKKK